MASRVLIACALYGTYEPRGSQSASPPHLLAPRADRKYSQLVIARLQIFSAINIMKTIHYDLETTGQSDTHGWLVVKAMLVNTDHLVEIFSELPSFNIVVPSNKMAEKVDLTLHSSCTFPAIWYRLLQVSLKVLRVSRCAAPSVNMLSSPSQRNRHFWADSSNEQADFMLPAQLVTTSAPFVMSYFS